MRSKRKSKKIARKSIKTKKYDGSPASRSRSRSRSQNTIENYEQARVLATNLANFMKNNVGDNEEYDNNDESHINNKLMAILLPYEIKVKYETYSDWNGDKTLSSVLLNTEEGK